MKRGIAILLALFMLVSLGACGRSYRKIDVPKALSLDPSALTEDMDDLMSIDDSTPLVAALPKEGLYVYATDETIVSGVLFKYDGLIQYFSWSFTPLTAKPEVYLADYNGDGQTDIAFTYCDTASEIRHNENLHVLLRDKNRFTDCAYTWKSAAVDTSMGIAVDDNGDGTFTAYLNGVSATAAFDAAGFGSYLGIDANQTQDFTLGETIRLTVQPGLVFSNRQQPVYDAFICTAVMRFNEDGVLRPADLRIDATES